MKTSFPVTGMHCASCAHIIKSKLEKIEGVESCEVNPGTEKAEIVFDEGKVGVKRMNEILKPLGYALKEVTKSPQPPFTKGASHEPALSQDPHDHVEDPLETLRWKLKVAIPLTIFSILVMAWDFATRDMVPAYWRSVVTYEALHHLMAPMATVMLFLIGPQYLKAIWVSIKHRVANMDTLVGIGTGVAYAYSLLVSMFAPLLDKYADKFIDTTQLYYDVTIVVIGFITLGKFLEANGKAKTGEAVRKLVGFQAKIAILERDGAQTEVLLESVQIGDIMIVKPGQRVPTDGVIVEGSSAIDESMINGEPIPSDKKAGDEVVGGTINQNGMIKVRATKVGQDTMLAHIIAMVQQAQGSRAPIQRLADKVSAVFVPTVLGIAFVTFLAWIGAGFFLIPMSQGISLGLVSFVGILVIACPCAMGLATPTAIITGVGRAAEKGILVKNAESLEKLAGVTHVVFDKTGTITEGKPIVSDFVPAADMPEEEILSLLVSIEANSSHPLAQAVVDYGRGKNLAPQSVEDFKEVPGKGLEASIAGKRYAVGNVAMMESSGITVDQARLSSFALQGKTPVIFARENEVLAYMGISDTLKLDAKDMIARLHRMGITTVMLTGDHEETGKHIGTQVGINTVFARVLPEDKAHHIKELKKGGAIVAMVGDGINDAPALATADVGLAMATGTDVAIESAGITILGGNVSKIPQAMTLARKTLGIIRQNLFWAFAYNVIGIPIAAGLLYPHFHLSLSPAIAGAAMALSSVSVVANSLRLRHVAV